MLGTTLVHEFLISYSHAEWTKLGGETDSAIDEEKELGPDYQYSYKVTVFRTLYLELQLESYNVPAML